MLHFGCELRGLTGRYVGKIGDDQIETAFYRLEQVALPKPDAFQKAELLCVFTRERERVRGQVDGMQLGLRKAGGERNNDDSAAGANIKDARRLWPAQVSQLFDQLLGFGARDKGAPVGRERVIGEFDRANEMLQRFAQSAPAHELAQRRQLRLGQSTFELQVELDALLA